MEDALAPRAFVGGVEADSGDVELAHAAKHDPRAFGELYERYHARVYRYVYHRVGTQVDAEDITAQVFMKALEALPSYQPKRSSFAPWIFRITHNAVIDHYRRRKYQQPIEGVEKAAEDPGPLGQALALERQVELRALVDHLSPEQRDVVLMRYVGDLSFAEIATVMNKNEPAVRMLLHRGLRRLKAVMDDDRLPR